MHLPTKFLQDRGSALVTVVLTMVVLSLIAATVLSSIASRHVVAHQAPHWHGAFNAAEAGADYGLAALRAGTWTGWSAEGDAASYYRRTAQLVLESSGGAPMLFANVTIDAPPTMKIAGNQHYRVRSTGHSKMVSSKRRAGLDKRDGRLRKIGMFNNRYTEAAFANTDLSNGHALVSRRIEAVAKPALKGIFPAGVHCDQLFDLDSQNYFDSYDSSDPSKSTYQNLGGRITRYDPNEKQKNGDIATNASNGWDLNLATILGDVLANAAPYIKGDANLDGQKRTDFFTPMAPVPTPSGTWTNFTAGTNSTTNLKNGSGSGTKADPRRYKTSDLKMDANGELRLANGDGEYVEVWITGDVTIANGAKIRVDSDVHVTIFFEGKFEIQGKGGSRDGLDNQSGIPSQVVLYGLTVGGKSTDVILHDFYFTGALYAPNHKVKFDMKGKDACGAFVSKQFDTDGASRIHYDEALKSFGFGATDGYDFISWVEDVR